MKELDGFMYQLAMKAELCTSCYYNRLFYHRHSCQMTTAMCQVGTDPDDVVGLRVPGRKFAGGNRRAEKGNRGTKKGDRGSKEGDRGMTRGAKRRPPGSKRQADASSWMF